MKQSDLARALGVSLVMLWKLKRRGMPIDDLEAAIRWRAEHLVPTRLKGVKRGTKVNVSSAETAMVNAALLVRVWANRRTSRNPLSHHWTTGRSSAPGTRPSRCQ